MDFMELRHLRYFVGVASELSFTRAAQKLHVAQPALSRQIRQLEDELGTRLLDRKRNGVELTPAGRAFLAEAASLLRQSEQAARAARQAGQGNGEPLRLGYIWGLFHSYVPAVLQSFRLRAPETAVHLFDLPPLEQARMINEGALDAGFIGFADEADSAGLLKRRIGRCEFVAALPRGHRAGRKSRIPLASLAGEFFLGISTDTYPGAAHCVTAACRRAGFRPKILQTVERGYTILGLVAGNCGVALVPESLKALPHPGIVFRQLAEPPTADMFLAWRKGAAHPALPRFLETVGSVAQF